jgi:hypothetical protein
MKKILFLAFSIFGLLGWAGLTHTLACSAQGCCSHETPDSCMTACSGFSHCDQCGDCSGSCCAEGSEARRDCGADCHCLCGCAGSPESSPPPSTTPTRAPSLDSFGWVAAQHTMECAVGGPVARPSHQEINPQENHPIYITLHSIRC